MRSVVLLAKDIHLNRLAGDTLPVACAGVIMGGALAGASHRNVERSVLIELEPNSKQRLPDFIAIASA